MIEPSTFEENKISFDHHKKVEHEIWLYPYFIKYLENKSIKDYTGDELEVWNKYRSGSDDWMPFKNTQYLKVLKLIIYFP